MANVLFRLFLVISESLGYCLLYLYAASGCEKAPRARFSRPN